MSELKIDIKSLGEKQIMELHGLLSNEVEEINKRNHKENRIQAIEGIETINGLRKFAEIYYVTINQHGKLTGGITSVMNISQRHIIGSDRKLEETPKYVRFKGVNNNPDDTVVVNNFLDKTYIPSIKRPYYDSNLTIYFIKPSELPEILEEVNKLILSIIEFEHNNSVEQIKTTFNRALENLNEFDPYESI